jgi:phosphate transport system substrate-binding protein
MPPDGRLSVVFVLASGSCPLVNYEYAGVSTQQPNPAVAAEIRIFLE